MGTCTDWNRSPGSLSTEVLLLEELLHFTILQCLRSVEVFRDELLKTTLITLGDSVPLNMLKFALSFSINLKSSWIISVELAIGPEEGISYLTDKGANVSLFLFSSLSYWLNSCDLLWVEHHTKRNDKSGVQVKLRRAGKFNT